VIYSLATSGPDDAPHGIEFLFSRHRLNVAEVGENIHAGQPVLVIEATGKRWLLRAACECAAQQAQGPTTAISRRMSSNRETVVTSRLTRIC
jgi:hypothetical protein